MNDEANLALSNHLFVIYHYLFIYKLSLVSCLGMVMDVFSGNWV